MQRKIINIMLVILTIFMSLLVVPNSQVEAQEIQLWEVADDSEEFVPTDPPLARHADDDRRDRNGTGWFWRGSDRRWFYYIRWNLQINWVKVSGHWYFLNPPLFNTGHQPGTPRGAMLTGWRRVGISNSSSTTDWFYFDRNGRMQTRWQLVPISNSSNTTDWFYFGSNGRMRTGRNSIWWSNSDHTISCMVFRNDGRWIRNQSTYNARCN